MNIINIDLCKQTLRDLQRHKVRTFLAAFGIIWGTVAVIILLALGEGFYQTSSKSLLTLAQGSIAVYANVTSKPYHGLPSGRTIPIKADEILYLKKALPNIQLISPRINKNATISYQNHQTALLIEGVAPDYQILAKKQLQPGGRFINSLDIQQQSAVIILGDAIKNKLFPHSEALGKEVLLNNAPFTVIGVFKKNPLMAFFDTMADIPYTSAISLWGNLNVWKFILQPNSSDQTAKVMRNLQYYMSYYYHFDPTDSTAIYIYNASEDLAFMNWFLKSIELFLGFCGALTLGVGGVGIANVMFLIVTERRAEIGLKLALGARDTQILAQFLLETLLIVLGGALIGIILAWSGILVLQYVPLPNWLGTPPFSGWILLVTILILTTIGLIAGYFPARRAANLQPVEALAF